MKLEQAEQKPVAWVEVERGIPMFMNFTENYKPNINNGIAPLYAAPQPVKQAEQEPVAWMNDSTPMGVFARHKEGAENFGCTIPLYAAPVRTKDLTDDEISNIWDDSSYGDSGIDFARAVIAADREKNRGTA